MGFLGKVIKNTIKNTSPIAGAIIDAIDSNQSEEYADDSITFESVLEQIDDLIDKDLYDEAISLLDKAKSSQLLESNSDFWLYYFEKARCLYWKGMQDEYDENERERKTLIRQSSLNLDQASKYSETKEDECIILAFRAKTDSTVDKGGERRYYIGALGTDDEELKSSYLKEYENCTFFMKDFFETYKELTADSDEEYIEFAEECKFT